jgi:hypothetical protein
MSVRTAFWDANIRRAVEAKKFDCQQLVWMFGTMLHKRSTEAWMACYGMNDREKEHFAADNNDTLLKMINTFTQWLQTCSLTLAVCVHTQTTRLNEITFLSTRAALNEHGFIAYDQKVTEWEDPIANERVVVWNLNKCSSS